MSSRKATLGIIIISLIAVILITALAIPSPKLGLLTQNEQQIIQSQLIEDLRRAKLAALTATSRVVLTIDDDEQGYQIGFDNLPYEDEPLIDSLILSRRLPLGGRISASKPIIIDIRGQLIRADGTEVTNDLTLLSPEGIFYQALVNSQGLFKLK